MLKYLIFFLIGGIVGRVFKLKDAKMKKVQILQSLSVLLILFIMGINLGKNKELFSNIGKIGFRSTAFAIFSILISILLVYIYEKYVYKRRKGEGAND